MKWLALSLIPVLVSCSPPSGPHKPVGVSAKGEVSYEKVRPIFAKYCAGCHPSRSGPDWLDFNQAKNYVLNGRLLQRVVVDRSMPPPRTAESAAMDDRERQVIAQWVRSGGQEDSRPPLRAPAQNLLSPVLQRCFECHGIGGPGSETDPKIPRLAGQNESYLILQLNNFKWRERLDPTDRMNEAVVKATDQEIAEMARYFSTRPSIAGHPLATDSDRRIFSVGQKLAQQSCNVCHMNERTQRPLSEWTPVLRGQSKQYLINQLLYFRNKERLSPLMHEFSRELTREEIAAVALFYSSF